MLTKKTVNAVIIFLIISLFVILEVVFFNYLYKITPRVRVRNDGTKIVYKIKK